MVEKINEQLDGPYKEHIDKIRNPEKYGGREYIPKWKKDAQKAINIAKKYWDKMKNTKTKNKIGEKITEAQKQLDSLGN